MNKREYIQANRDWLEAKSKEEGVKALPKGIYYKVLSEGNQSSATPTVRSIITANGEIAVSNVHVGSLGDIVASSINVAPDLQVTKMQLLDAVLKEMSHEGFTETDADDFWDDMMDLRKAKNIR